MSIEVERDPFAVVPQEHFQLEPIEKRDASRRRSASSWVVIGASVVLLLAGCSSKNPDALMGLNVDENLAMMNANSSSGANSMVANASTAATTSAQGAGNQSDRSADTAPKARSRGRSDDQQPSAQINAIGPDADNPADISDNTQNQVGNEDQPPNR